MAIERRELTDALIRNLKPGPAPRIIADTLSPLRVKVSPTGAASYQVWGRFGGASSPASRTIGRVGSVKLGEARETARQWVQLGRGKDDPLRLERERRERQAEDRAVTFGVVWQDYCRLRLAKQRRGERTRREVEREVLKVWRDRPLKEITKRDVVKVVDKVMERDAPYHARNVLGGVTAFFNWAVDRGIYGIEAAPTDRVRKKGLIGETPHRQRVLTDDELRAYWRAAGRLGYPFGPLFKLLLLSGQRRSEVAEAEWHEFHPELVRLIRQRKDIDWAGVPDAMKLWTVPPARFKSNATHMIPLSDAICALLADLPYFKGPRLFTTTAGVKPVSGFSRAKERLDARMQRTLRAIARLRGEDWRVVKLEPFVVHDLRRTMRTRLSSLKVPDHVSEMIVGHGRRGIQRVYDQWSYTTEMREALEAWAEKLRNIVKVPGRQDDNVFLLKTRAS